MTDNAHKIFIVILCLAVLLFAAVKISGSESLLAPYVKDSQTAGGGRQTFTDGDLKIESIDKIIDGGKINLYLVFSRPAAEKESSGWHIKVILETRSDFLKFAPQAIDSVYSYKPDSGSFIINLPMIKTLPAGAHSLTFLVRDLLSNQSSEKSVAIKF